MPTHERLSRVDDVELLVRGLCNANINTGCVVDMLRDGAAEQHLLEALDVIKENEEVWHDQIYSIVREAMSKWNRGTDK